MWVGVIRSEIRYLLLKSQAKFVADDILNLSYFS